MIGEVEGLGRIVGSSPLSCQLLETIGFLSNIPKVPLNSGLNRKSCEKPQVSCLTAAFPITASLRCCYMRKGIPWSVPVDGLETLAATSINQFQDCSVLDIFLYDLWCGYESKPWYPAVWYSLMFLRKEGSTYLVLTHPYANLEISKTGLVVSRRLKQLPFFLSLSNLPSERESHTLIFFASAKFLRSIFAGSLVCWFPVPPNQWFCC